MHFRKYISVWALLALIFGQFALVQHSAEHIDHEFSQEIVASHDYPDHHHHDDQEENEQHECLECSLVKSLQTAFYNSPVTLFINSSAEAITLSKQSGIFSSTRNRANSPRAPPKIFA